MRYQIFMFPHSRISRISKLVNQIFYPYILCFLENELTFQCFESQMLRIFRFYDLEILETKFNLRIIHINILHFYGKY